MAELGQTTFFDYVRGSRTAQGRLADDGSARLEVTIGLQVVGVRASQQPSKRDVMTAIQLLGPADIIGIAPTEILRVFPARSEPAAEPNYLASIEFDSPELPWLASLSTEDTKPMPWIALVVVAERDAPDPPLISHRFGSPVQWLSARTSELPPCLESWAWAHAQVVGKTDDPQGEFGDGRKTLSRLLCPTHLQPNTRYVAAVVPTYRAGVEAASGDESEGTGATPAWGTADEDIVLPMYHWWRFATGPGGDFEQLARQLRPVDAHDLPVGSFALRLADGGLPRVGFLAGGELPPAGTEEQLEAVPTETPVHALRTLLTTERELAALNAETTAGTNPAIVDALTQALNPATGEDDARIVRPPRYGQYPAGDVPVDEGPPWFGPLNLAPSSRVIARVGADVVRAQQEELVAEAQRQLGAYEKARRVREHLRLGELTATRLHQRTVVADVAPDERVLAVARPAFRELAVTMEQPVVTTLDRHGLGAALLAPALARVAQRAGRRTDFAAGKLRTQLVSGMLDGTLIKIAAPPERQVIELDRLRRVYSRAGILERPIGQLTVEKVLTLAQPATTMQHEFVAQFAGMQLAVNDAPPAEGPSVEPPVDMDPRVFGHLRGEPLGLAGLHVAALNVAAPEPAAAVHALSFEPHGLRQHVVTPIGAVFDPFRRMPEAAAVTRVPVAEVALGAPAATSVHTALGVLAGFGVQPVAAEATISDLVVDARTVKFARDLSAVEGVAAEPELPAFDARTAVRRQLGFSSAQPVLRDQLPADGQERFDQVVDLVSKRLLTNEVRFPAPPPPVTVAAAAEPCRDGLLATSTYTAAAARRLTLAAGLVPTEIHMGFVPTFSAPLVARLERSLDRWILAGAERIPPNAVTMLVTNPAFVEALVAGANHEMARELLWRDIPSDPRASVFERFWTGDAMPPMHTWGALLGENLDTATDPFVAVVMRSPLLRRYPNAVIYAATGSADGGNFEPDVEPPRLPLYTGFINPDITYSVIDLKQGEALDPNKNWCLLLAEPVGEPRFGLDAAATDARGPLLAWGDAAWTDTDPDHKMLSLAHPPGGKATLEARLLPGADSPDPPQRPLTWGESSAHLAHILHQDPFRVVMRATSFLKGGNA